MGDPSKACRSSFDFERAEVGYSVAVMVGITGKEEFFDTCSSIQAFERTGLHHSFCPKEVHPPNQGKAILESDGLAQMEVSFEDDLWKTLACRHSTSIFRVGQNQGSRQRGLSETMSEITDGMLYQLEDGFCHHADVERLLREINWERLEAEKPPGVNLQAITPNSQLILPNDEQIRNALREMLESGKIEIGNTALDSRGYLVFVAWKGTVDERVDRAMGLLKEYADEEHSFVYWLCPRERVSRYENSK